MARFVADFADAARALGHRVVISVGRGSGADHAERLLDGRIEVGRLPAGRREAVRSVLAAVRSAGPDWVLLVTGAWPPSTRLGGAFGRVPVVETPRVMPRRRRVKLGQRVSFTVRSTRRYRLVAINEEMAALSRSSCGAAGRAVRVVPNCIKLPRERREYQWGDVCRFVSFARLDESHKDHETTLRALALLDRSLRRSWEMLFIGTGPDARSLEDLSRELGVGARFVSGVDDLWSEVASHDVSVLSTKREGLPRVGVEAAAIGLATIGSDVPGVSDLFSGGAGGVLVSPGDAGAMASVMERMIRDAAWREAVAAGGPEVAARHEAMRAARVICSVAEEML